MRAFIKLTGAIMILQVHLQVSSEANFLLSKPSSLLIEAKEYAPDADSFANGNQPEEEVDHLSLDELAAETRKLNKWPTTRAGSASGGGANDDADDDKPKTSEHNTRNQDERLLRASDKHLFVVEILKMLHEQYGKKVVSLEGNDRQNLDDVITNKEDRHQPPISKRQSMMLQLLEAISADGDIRRLKDWVQNSFNMASLGDLTTQFVVSKLGSVNCAALFKSDPEESLVPRFLLFNEHYVDVPYELTLAPTTNECLIQGRFDPFRKTVVLIHGYLTGYTLVDGMTNIKNRLLDINKIVDERALEAFTEASRSNGSYLLTGDLELKLRRQKYNVIIVDWFSGANPVPRANYIQAAANARVVGDIIANFLMSLATQCRTPSTNIQIMAHSLGCHVAGFTGKAMGAAGHTLGKITHLDPIGLCFGRLFSNPRFRLSPNDAIDTQAVHVSLNIFDNPLDGARSNFLVNGGRDQSGCQVVGTSELQNSTTSSVSLLFDPNAKFSPCSHLRALSLFEDDLSSSSGKCQIVGYRCDTYERFLAGKCGKCDAMNNQCRLMSFQPILKEFTGIHLGPAQVAAGGGHHKSPPPQRIQVAWRDSSSPAANSNLPQSLAVASNSNSSGGAMAKQHPNMVHESHELLKLVKIHSNGSIAWVIDDQELNAKIGNAIAKMKPKLVMGQSSGLFEGDKSGKAKSGNSLPAEAGSSRTIQQYPESSSRKYTTTSGNEVSASRRSDRSLIGEHPRELIAQTLDKIRTDTRNALTGGWTSIRNIEPKYKVSSIFGSLAASPSMGGLFSGLMVPHRPIGELDHISFPLVDSASGSSSGRGASTDTIPIPAGVPNIPTPIGSQPLPAGSSIGPLYFVGTGALSPYCVNYYQFRMLIAESRIKKLMQTNKSALNRMAHISSHGHPQHSQQDTSNKMQQQQQQQQSNQQQQVEPPRQALLSRDMLHLTIKLSDSHGHFFKGFTITEDVRLLPRAPASELMGTRGPTSSETMVELTMLLNSTSPEPVRIGETIISYYFHTIVLADIVEVTYMSNISPDVRARFSSILCPVAINDQHQLVRYIECDKIAVR